MAPSAAGTVKAADKGCGMLTQLLPVAMLRLLVQLLLMGIPFPLPLCLLSVVASSLLLACILPLHAILVLQVVVVLHA